MGQLVSFYLSCLLVSKGELRLSYRPEAALALRQRLNEVVEQLEEVQKQHNELQVAHESQSRELTIAKSDRTAPFLHP